MAFQTLIQWLSQTFSTFFVHRFVERNIYIISINFFLFISSHFKLYFYILSAVFYPSPDSSVLIKEESNEADEPESFEAIHTNHQSDKRWTVETKGYQSNSGLKYATNQISKIGKDPIDSVSRSPEAKLDAPCSVSKLSRKKQKTVASKVRRHFHISLYRLHLHYISFIYIEV